MSEPVSPVFLRNWIMPEVIPVFKRPYLDNLPCEVARFTRSRDLTRIYLVRLQSGLYQSASCMELVAATSVIESDTREKSDSHR